MMTLPTRAFTTRPKNGFPVAAQAASRTAMNVLPALDWPPIKGSPSSGITPSISIRCGEGLPSPMKIKLVSGFTGRSDTSPALCHVLALAASSRLLKKRCNDASPLSDWKCRALCLPIWSTLAQSGGYADQSGQLDEIVGRHRQGELEVELPNAT